MQPCARLVALVHRVRFNWESWRSDFNGHLYKLKVEPQVWVLICLFAIEGLRVDLGKFVARSC